MNKKASWLAVVAAIVSLQSNAKVIQGKVESETGRALDKAEIKVRGADIVTTANEQGMFQLDLPVGTYTIDVEAGSRAHFHQVIEVTDEAQQPFVLSMKSEPEHKVVVRANPLEHTTLDMATPTIIVAGDELTIKRSGTLGDILQFEPGLNVSSFGPSVSRPVIRGLGGGRVTITNNQMIVQDASTTSADHDVGIEPLLAET